MTDSKGLKRKWLHFLLSKELDKKKRLRQLFLFIFYIAFTYGWTSFIWYRFRFSTRYIIGSFCNSIFTVPSWRRVNFYFNLPTWTALEPLPLLRYNLATSWPGISFFPHYYVYVLVICSFNFMASWGLWLPDEVGCWYRLLEKNFLGKLIYKDFKL